MNRTIERWYPATFGLALFLGAFALSSAQKVMIATELANPIINILAIMFGFLAAALAILLTAADVRSIKQLKQAKHFGYLMDYLSASINLAFFAALMSLAAIIVCKSVQKPPQLVIFLAWTFMVGWAFAAFFRVMYILIRLLRRAEKTDQANPRMSPPPSHDVAQS